MLSDVEQFFWIILAIYWVEAMHWLRPGAVVTLCQLGGPHRLRWLANGAGLRNDHGGILLGHLTPLGRTTFGEPWPFAVSPVGVVGLVTTASTPDGRPDLPGTYHALTANTHVKADGWRVYVDGQHLTTASSPGLAKHYADELRALAQQPESARADAIAQMFARHFDVPRVRQKFDRLLLWGLPLQLLTVVLFAYVFGLLGLKAFGPFWQDDVPAVGRWLQWMDRVFWLDWLIVYVGLALLTAFAFVITAWRVGVLRSAGGQVGMVLVSPADAMHAHDYLCSSLFLTYHPLAQAAVLSRAANFTDLATRSVRDLHFPLPDPPAPTSAAAAEVLAWYQPRYADAVRACVQAQGLDPAACLAPPVAESALCQGYCPRCHGQYERATGACTQCDLPLHTWAPIAPLAVVVSNPPPVPPPPKPKKPGKKKKRSR
jgi:hypothetical protein